MCPAPPSSLLGDGHPNGPFTGPSQPPPSSGRSLHLHGAPTQTTPGGATPQPSATWTARVHHSSHLPPFRLAGNPSSHGPWGWGPSISFGGKHEEGCESCNFGTASGVTGLAAGGSSFPLQIGAPASKSAFELCFKPWPQQRRKAWPLPLVYSPDRNMSTDSTAHRN